MSAIYDRKQDVWQGTLAIMVLKTLEAMGPQARLRHCPRIEQVSARPSP